jgi:2,3-dihydroxybenzoate decarboxylase
VGAILQLRADRIMFSTDWPFENVDHIADQFDSALISERWGRRAGAVLTRA